MTCAWSESGFTAGEQQGAPGISRSARLRGWRVPVRRRQADAFFTTKSLQLTNLPIYMAEKSFSDRHDRGETLRDMCAGFTPAFAPADTSLTAPNFSIFLGTLGALNTEINMLEGNYTTYAGTREATVKTLKAAATRVVARLKSNSVWSSEEKSARKVLLKLRGVRPKKPKPPAEGEPPAEEKKRNSGEQAYGEVALLFEKFIGVATAAAGYATGVPVDISAGALNGLLSSLKGSNSFLCNLGAQISPKQKKRQKLYFEKGGFAEKFQAIKEAVKSQYGTQSEQYLAARAVKW